MIIVCLLFGGRRWQSLTSAGAHKITLSDFVFIKQTLIQRQLFQQLWFIHKSFAVTSYREHSTWRHSCKVHMKCELYSNVLSNGLVSLHLSSYSVMFYFHHIHSYSVTRTLILIDQIETEPTLHISTTATLQHHYNCCQFRVISGMRIKIFIPFSHSSFDF